MPGGGFRPARVPPMPPTCSGDLKKVVSNVSMSTYVNSRALRNWPSGCPKRVACRCRRPFSSTVCREQGRRRMAASLTRQAVAESGRDIMSQTMQPADVVTVEAVKDSSRATQKIPGRWHPTFNPVLESRRRCRAAGCDEFRAVAVSHLAFSCVLYWWRDLLFFPRPLPSPGRRGSCSLATWFCDAPRRRAAQPGQLRQLSRRGGLRTRADSHSPDRTIIISSPIFNIPA